MKSYLKILREKEQSHIASQAIGLADRDLNDREQLDMHSDPQSSSKAHETKEQRSRTPLTIINQARNTKVEGKMSMITLEVKEKKPSLVLPYKHTHKRDKEEEVVVRIHYSKSKSANLHINANSNPKQVAANFWKTYGLGRAMYENLIKKTEQLYSQHFN